MDALINPLLAPLTAEPAGRALLGWGMLQMTAFTLVLLRIAGLMTLGPLWGNRMIPMQARALLALGLAALLTPTLPQAAAIGFARLDADGNGRIAADEVPAQLQSRFQRRLSDLGRGAEADLTPQEWPAAPQLPVSILDYAATAVTEFALGLALGLGVATLLSGLQLAGELIDQQTGLALAEVFNPGFEELDGGATGRFLFLFGTAVFLALPPLDGHLLVFAALVETFQTLPVGEATISADLVHLLSALVHGSMVLGLQVAAPVLAAMSLVALAMGMLGHTVPQVNVLVIGFPIRAIINLAILALTFSGAAETLILTLTQAIDALRHTLSGLP